MILHPFTPPRTSQALLLRLVWWASILLIGAVLLGMSIVQVMSWRADAEALTNERDRLSSSIAQRAVFL
ncbi:MAG TPA: hypothetical protein VLQ65_06135 [Saliniramus sp.]|nr:hypothetical protein [Saliniramus sp.]